MEEELLGCWHEAQRADRMIDELRRIRAALYPDFGAHIDTLIKEIQTSSRLLRDLWDLFRIYESRTPMIAYYLEVLLPCLCKTLMEMKEYVNRPDLIPAAQWLRMFDALTEEGRMPLWNRFVMYNEFLVQLIRLLSRSLLHDPTTLELLRNRIIHLRLLRGIPEPPTLYPPVVPEPPRPHSDSERPHWATKVFEDVPHSVTSLRHRRESRCFGPSMSEARQGIVPGSSVLFKLPFDKNHLSITASLQPEEGGPNITRILCRYMDSYFHPVYSCYGVHELCVKRIGSSLQFRRYSTRRHHSTPWIALFFQTWERMVLFHCAFISLKARCPLTLGMHPADYTLGGEKKLFQGKILDDGYLHSLAVFEEKNTFGLRLHAAVWDGELTRCPIWTAFITHQSTSPEWLVRKSRRRIWLMDIRPYVFCDEYQHRHQRQRHGEFEIHFVEEKAADKFVDVFFPESPASSISSFGF